MFYDNEVLHKYGAIQLQINDEILLKYMIK